MPQVFKDLVLSKKFVFVLMTTFALIVAAHFDALPKEDVVTLLKILWPVYIGAQGIADIGENLAAGKVAAEEVFAEVSTKKSEAVNAFASQFFPMLLEMSKTSFGSFSKGPPSDHATASQLRNWLMTIPLSDLNRIIAIMTPEAAKEFTRLMETMGASPLSPEAPAPSHTGQA